MSSSDLIILTDVSSSQGGLLPSSLTGTSFNSGEENNSSLIGLQKTSTTSSASSLIDTNQETLTNYSNSVSTISDSLSLFNKSVVSTSLASQSLPNNPTIGLDPLTGNGKNLSLVGINSNDSLLNPSPVLKGKFGNFDNHQNFQLTLQDANGNPESFSLTGDGEGEVFQTDLGEQIIFTGTDGTTNVQISASNNLRFGDYIGSELNVQTKGSITISNILSNGGAINLTSYQRSVTSKGNITTSGGDISLTSTEGLVAVSGTLDASSLANGHKGGTVQVLGNTVALLDQAQINVSGNAGGGTALIGGDYQGKGTVPRAQSTFVSNGAKVNADAVNSGNGGKVVVWSDNTTRFLGNISARGGSKSGNGGMVEVSGKQLLDFQGMVYANAVNGLAGTLLLDPKNIIIDDSQERAAYISGPYDYWGSSATDSNQNAMNAAFGGYGGDPIVVQGGGYGGDPIVVQGGGYGGDPIVVQGGGYGGDPIVVQGGAGNWDNLSLLSAGATPFATGTGNDYKFIFLDGGDSQAVNLSNYLATNSASIDAWVKQGGHLFINAAPNVGGSFSLGFGVTLNYDGSSDFAWDVVAADLSHPIFNGPLPTATSFHGNYFSHATVSGGGITPILLRNSGDGGDPIVVQGGGDGGNIVLGEEAVGQGLALFGGMTTTNWHTPQPSANNLLVNILEYASASTPTPLSANDLFAQNPDVTTTISPTQITKITNAGTAVVLQANNDITVNKAITTSAVGSGGSLTLQAGRSINVNANITTDNGDLTLKANDSDAIAAQRDPGAAVITMANGTTLNAGTGKVSVSLNRGTEGGNNPSGDVTIGSITAKQVDILSDGGVNTQSDIETNGGDVNITALKDIAVQKITAQNGGISLVSSTGAITASSEITADNGVTALAKQDITTDKLISNSGAVKLTSKQGAVITQDITSDSDTIIAASQKIATGTILTNNGAVKLTSQQSFITTKNITTKGASVTVIAEDDITTRNILSNGGVIDLVSRNGSITTGYLRSDSSAKEGDITVLAADLVKVQGSVSINGNNYSIYSGKKGEGFITIQYGGRDTKVPFVVGNATENGTVGAISIGNSTIFPTSSRHDFSGSYTLGNGADSGVIRIISSDNKDLDKSLKELIVAEFDDDPFKGLKALEWLGDKIFESVEWTFEAIEDGFTQITNASGGRVVIEAGRELTPEEADIAAKLAKEGRLVEALQEGTSNTKRVYYSDFLVDGVKTELKTVSNIEVNLSATPAKLADKLSDALLSRMRDAARQADNVIVDARSQPGINRQIAERTLRRAENSIKSLKGPRQIRIIGPDFDLSLSF